jgi:hypothetical protein
MDMMNTRQMMNLVHQQEKELDHEQISKEKEMIQSLLESDQEPLKNKTGELSQAE